RLPFWILVLAREHGHDVRTEHAVQMRHLRGAADAIAPGDIAVARRAVGTLARGGVAELELLELSPDAGALVARRDRDRHRVHRVVLAEHRIVVAALGILVLLERSADREADELPRISRRARCLGDD